jgi:hypothetical protein
MTRRLQILPEILPAPTKATPNQAVRARTVAHMQRLLATAAAIPLAGCTRPDTQATSQTVTLPTAQATATASPSDSTAQGSLLPPPTATAPATATATAPTTGYAVVDPMPAPARCMGLASASKVTAAFKRHGGDWVLEVAVTLPAGPAWRSTTFVPGSGASPWSGTLVSSSVTSRTAKGRLKVPAGSKATGVVFEVACPSGNGHLAAAASFPGAPSASTKVAVTLTDY